MRNVVLLTVSDDEANDVNYLFQLIIFLVIPFAQTKEIAVIDGDLVNQSASGACGVS